MPGDVFGELAMLDAGPRTASAVALEDTELLEVDRADLLLLVGKKPEAALHLLGAMGAMTRKAELEIAHLHDTVDELRQSVLERLQRIETHLLEAKGS